MKQLYTTSETFSRALPLLTQDHSIVHFSIEFSFPGPVGSVFLLEVFLLGVYLLKRNALSKTVFLRIAWGLCLGVSAYFCVFLCIAWVFFQ